MQEYKFIADNSHHQHFYLSIYNVFLLLLLLLAGNNAGQPLAASSTSLTAAQPRFLSRGHTYRAVVGDTLVLPCQVENLGKTNTAYRELK